jgi:hypothetical protein
VGRLVTSNYDLASRCNLHCEGCLFFAGDDYKQYAEVTDPGAWRAFFRSERARGVNFGYFAGAEPSMELERLRIADAYIDRGVIFTNGLVPIPRDISFRIHVSIWGDEAQSIQTRGAGNLKALKHYRGDPRVAFVFTVTATNIHTIHAIAAAVQDTGSRLTFNLFSPTTKYLNERAGLDAEDRKFFRRRGTSATPVLGADDLRRATDEIYRAIADFPQAVLYSPHFHDWVTRPEGIYELDPATGIARNCGNRLSERHRHYNVDLSATAAKCCSPNIDCSQCRAYAMSYATFLKAQATPRVRTAASAEWLEVWDIWARLFLGEDEGAPVPPSLAVAMESEMAL